MYALILTGTSPLRVRVHPNTRLARYPMALLHAVPLVLFALPPPPPPAVLGFVCVEICIWSSDGDCDDGGPGAEYADCGYGADCIDCGVRQGQPPRAPPPPRPPRSPPPPPSPPRAPGSVCVENCNWSSDGDCDDGGPGAEYADCGYGADCLDCGVRQGQPPRAPPPPRAPGSVCVENCNWSSDGDCDDGGPGAEYSDCGYGADCIDCGPRQALPPSPSPPSPLSSPPSPVSSPPPLSGIAALMISAKNSKPIAAVVVACAVGLVAFGACLCCRRARRSTPIVRAYDGTGQELPSLTTAPLSAGPSAGPAPVHRGAPNERLRGMEAAIEAAFGRHVALKARYARKRLFRAGRFKAFDGDEPTSTSSGDSKI